MNAPPAYDLAPALGVIGIGLLIAFVPFAWAWQRSRGQGTAARLHAFAVLTLFLCFDLVLLGAYTRLSDSGLGCPDWPGCYGHASPLGAGAAIGAAEAAIPSGSVTHSKAWVEMAHRYSATAIGLLLIALAVAATLAWRRRKVRVGPAAAIAALLWVCVQGGFGALTVTLSLTPAIVTIHLLGGLGLLALLVNLAERYAERPLPLPPALRRGLVVVAALVLLQITLGAWVSTNYAVLACREFPTCQGSWWPPMDFSDAFDPGRALGRTAAGGYLPFAALTAIHVMHRLGAVIVVPALAGLAARLWTVGGHARRLGLALAGIVAWQAVSGLANVLLDWPLAFALAHTAGSAALVVVLAMLIVRSRRGRVGRVETPARTIEPAF